MYDINSIWLELEELEYKTQAGYETFKKIHSHQEEFLRKKNTELNNEFSQRRNFQFEEIENQHQLTIDHEAMFFEELERLLRYAMVMSIYSFFEARLKDFVDLLESKFLSKNSENRIVIIDKLRFQGRGKFSQKSYISKYWRSIREIIKLNLGDAEHFFITINQQRKVRNIIAHKDGFSSGKEQFNPFPGLDFKRIPIRLEEIYIPELIKKMEYFYQEVFQQALKKY